MPEVSRKRVLAIGDIHGCSKALDTLLAAVNPSAEDTLVTLGDHVDRGPDSAGVLARLLRLRNTCHLVPLLGNHEQMMLEAREGGSKEREWLSEGGRQTLSSYSVLGDAGRLVDVPDEHWDFLKYDCVNWYETEKHFFVHANAYPDLPLNEQPLYMLRWEFFNDPPSHMSGKIMVCGHTIQKTGLPRHIGHAVCIDTGACKGGWLSCLEVTTGRLWQARQTGEQRNSWVDELIADV
jgi:serine/threonine protein phosphatase 1